MKYSFRNDYSEIAHPRILQALIDHNNEQNTGYGLDTHSINAEKKIQEIFGIPDSCVFFLTGGTQVNTTVISFLLKPYEAALCVDSGHINVHETGSVEGTGHKIYTMPNHNGKITPNQITQALKKHTEMHTVHIKLVYISNSTEFGTVYHKKELEDIYKVCKENKLLLFIDGARLAAALTSEENDMTPKEFANLCDVFYIGGTKIGLLSGEAVVFNNKEIAEFFRYHIKNRGAMLAKGFVMGIMFEEVFKNNLYFEMGKHENQLAKMVQDTFKELGVKLFIESPTNQIFPVVSRDMAKKIREYYMVEDWEDLGDDICIRFVFSWFTKDETVMELIKDLKEIFKK